MHLLWGIDVAVCRTIQFWICWICFRNGDFWLRNASSVCQQLFPLYKCVFACIIVGNILITTTRVSYRLSHIQHRNLKAFKWFAGLVDFNMVLWRHHHQSNPRCQTQVLLVVAKVARALSLLSPLSRACGQKITLYQKPPRNFYLTLSLARVINIAWPVQKRNFDLESLALSWREILFLSFFSFE